MSKSDILTSLNVATMLPLDSKAYANSEVELLNLGTSGIKAHSLYKGAKITNRENNIDYYWLEVSSVDADLYEAKGSIYTYPGDTPNIENIVYANKQYSFYVKKEVEVIPPTPEGEKVENKTGQEITGSYGILDEGNYDLFRLKGSDHISLKKVGNNIVIEWSETPIKNWWDNIIIKPDLPEGVDSIIRPYDPIFRDFTKYSEWITSNRDSVTMLDPDKVKIKISGSGDIGILPDYVSELKTINKEDLVSFTTPDNRVKPLSIKDGIFNPSLTSVKFDLTVKDATLANSTQIIQEELSKITLDNVNLSSPNNSIVAGGDLRVFNSKIGNGINTLSEQLEPAIVITSGARVTIDNSELNSVDLISVISDNNSITLTNNKVSTDVTGIVVKSNQGFSNSAVTSLGNLVPNGRMTDPNLQGLINVNNTTFNGTEYKLKTFVSLERAESELGPGKMFIQQDGLEGNTQRFVNITRGFDGI